MWMSAAAIGMISFLSFTSGMASPQTIATCIFDPEVFTDPATGVSRIVFQSCDRPPEAWVDTLNSDGTCMNPECRGTFVADGLLTRAEALAEGTLVQGPEWVCDQNGPGVMFSQQVDGVWQIAQWRLSGVVGIVTSGSEHAWNPNATTDCTYPAAWIRYFTGTLSSATVLWGAIDDLSNATVLDDPCTGCWVGVWAPDERTLVYARRAANQRVRLARLDALTGALTGISDPIEKVLEPRPFYMNRALHIVAQGLSETGQKILRVYDEKGDVVWGRRSPDPRFPYFLSTEEMPNTGDGRRCFTSSIADEAGTRLVTAESLVYVLCTDGEAFRLDDDPPGSQTSPIIRDPESLCLGGTIKVWFGIGDEVKVADSGFVCEQQAMTVQLSHLPDSRGLR
jgi:hypothetical protein